MPTQNSPKLTHAVRSSITAALLVCTLGGASGVALAQEPSCQALAQSGGFGPYNYRDRTPENLARIKLVEDHHFTPEMQRAAISGAPQAKFVRNNLDYTIRALPNHSRALFLLMIWEGQLQKFNPETYKIMRAGTGYSPPECYFERALSYAPKDHNVYTALARAQHRNGDLEGAVENFEKVVELVPRSAKAQYNLGLAYFAAERFEDAVKQARKARKMGYPRPELINKLKRKGHWQ